MRPLDDVRVLDLSRLLPGPFATLVLADLGATVDKVEDPGSGDYLRAMSPHAGGESAAFAALNRGKRSAVLDLKRPEAKAALLRMLPAYDVLFEQFRPGVLGRLGLGAEALRQANPRLVVCSLTGYGQTGPLAGRAGHDLNYLARAGVLSAQGPGSGPPQVPGFQLADVSGGMWSVIAILAALAERRRTGEGAFLDVAMADGVLGFATPSIAAALAGAPPERGADVLSGAIAPYNTYLSEDGHPISIGALEPKFLVAFMTAVGLTPSMDALVPGPHQTELKARFAEIFAGRTRQAWAEFAAAHDCCVEAATPLAELRRDPQLEAREIFFDLETPRGSLPQFRTPVTPRGVSFAPPPRAGEHTRAVLRDAGIAEAEIDALLASGAARQG